MAKGRGGKKPNMAKKKKRERWRARHPGLTRKEYAKQKRERRLKKQFK